MGQPAMSVSQGYKGLVQQPKLVAEMETRPPEKPPVTGGKPPPPVKPSVRLASKVEADFLRAEEAWRRDALPLEERLSKKELQGIQQLREKAPSQQTAKPTPKIGPERALKTGGGAIGAAGKGAGFGFLFWTLLSIGTNFTVGLVKGQSPGESIQSAVEAEKEEYTTVEGQVRLAGGMLGGSAGMAWAYGIIATNPGLLAGVAAAGVVVGMGYLGSVAGTYLASSIAAGFSDLHHSIKSIPEKLHKEFLKSYFLPWSCY
jgi:hypothetical protein